MSHDTPGCNIFWRENFQEEDDPEYSLEPENAPQPGPSRLEEEYPLIKHLHVFSDGPATQYKQKGNFYLLSKEPFKKGFKNISWNFFEASHGKGAPDGIGATLKRSTDTIVRHGGDIPNAEAMFHKLRDMGTSVELFFVGEDDVERKVKEIIDGPTLVPVKGTMKIHQVLSFSPGTIKYRDITCLCQADKGVLDCECYGLKEISLSQEASPHCTEGPTRPENITKDHIGQWCIINYDGEPYPGIILEVEEDVKVKCMHKNGTNKFHWPSPREDITWYRDDQVVCLMKEPTPLNKRSVQLERKVWDFLEKNWSCWSVA
ncbi:mitochondrial fission process protein 1 [Sarotherodon galilaeus]